MTKTYHFVAGLPRSGSTLLMNILGQNPRFHVSGTSGVMDVMFGVRNSWDQLIEFKARPDNEAKLRVLRGILESYYGATNHPIVFDKCRGWLSLLEMAENVLGRQARVLVPVRDLRDVLASFERLWRETSRLRQVPTEQQFYFDFQTVAGRCAVWMRPDQPVGLALNRINDALQRGFGDRMHFVHFNDLTTKPRETLREIYEFVQEPLFDHDFEHVEQLTDEDDNVYGFSSLHAIRSRVEPVVSRNAEILGIVADLYRGPYPWN